MSRDWRIAFRTTAAELKATLPADLRSFDWSASSWMAKVWYGNRALHYEIWVRHSAKVVEIGLHFEADELTNARLLGAFRMRAKDVKRALGTDARVEEWDRGWARVWEPVPFTTPDIEDRVRGRFCDYVRALEPILRDELPSDVDWKPRAAARAKPTRRTAGRTLAAPRATSSRTSR